MLQCGFILLSHYFILMHKILYGFTLTSLFSTELSDLIKKSSMFKLVKKNLNKGVFYNLF